MKPIQKKIQNIRGQQRTNELTSSLITYFQPFLTYITKTKTTIALNTESTYDWEGRDWSVPINLTVSQLFKIDNNLIQVGGGARYWVTTPESGPEGWGIRLTITLLFPTQTKGILLFIP